MKWTSWLTLFLLTVAVHRAGYAGQPFPPKEFTNSIGMKFVWIEPGSFLMGSPQSEEGRDKDETQHKVTLTKGFYLGIHTVTQEQWQMVMGKSLSQFKGEKNLPVEKISWHDCQEFLEKLGRRDVHSYRLPTEAEWEYASHAGSTSTYFYGDDRQVLGQYAWYLGNSEDKTHPVGQKKPNRWGLYDMHGNVLQWCLDVYEEYPPKAVVDPKGRASPDTSRVPELIRQLSSTRFAERQAATSALKGIGWPALPALREAAANGFDLETQRRAQQIMASIPKHYEYRVLRGSAFYDRATNVRTARRSKSLPGNTYYSYGMRAVMTLDAD